MPGRPFPPGVSGNPKGRARSLLNRAQVRRLLEGVVERALAGDTHAADILAEHYLGDKQMPHGFFTDAGRTRRTRDQHTVSLSAEELDPALLQQIISRMGRIEAALAMLAERDDNGNGNGNGDNALGDDPYEQNQNERSHKRESELYETTGDRQTKDAKFQDAFIRRTKQMQDNLRNINIRNREHNKAR